MLEGTYEHIKRNIHLLEIDYENGLVLNRKACFDTKGYLQITFKNKLVKVHQVIAFLKYGRDAINFQVDHLDGDKTNNRPTNLEMVTNLENYSRAKRMGLIRKGEESGRSKLNDSQVKEIKEMLRKGVKQKDIAAFYKVAPNTISKINTGECWGQIK